MLEAELPPGKGSVLVIEDEPGMAEILRLNLEASGYRVTVAEDGLEALKHLEADRPDLVTLDLNIPVVSGFRLIQLLKSEGDQLPVIVVTALSAQEAEEVVLAGADDFITKPFEMSDLVSRVEYVLARQRHA